ncbi:MAG: class I SAM-dependent methyltransferase [Candidatus Omnitrophica bacterium]|nr:class I SAM-dependent methyltransferase [Candidatus Omnitrophota bacterium]
MYKRKQHLQQVDENFYRKTETARCVHRRILLKVLAHIDKSRSLILFDYGCGFGYRMSSAKEFGITAYGVDIDEKRLALCEAQGLNVCQPDTFKEKFKDIKADVILWQNNIEHVVDLSQSASFIRKRCKKGAVLYVNGLTSTMIRNEQRRGSFIKAHFVEHLNYFPIKTLHRFMADYGFKPLNRPRYFQLQGKTVFIKDIVTSLFNTPALESITYRLRSSFGRLYRYER